MTKSKHYLDRVLEASVVGSFSSLGWELRRRVEHFTPLQARPGRVVVLTGATSGLGRYSALELSRLGCHVLAVGRNQSRLDELVRDAGSTEGSITGFACDLSDMDAVIGLADELVATKLPIEVIIHNAGALASSYSTTAQGFEVTLATHLLGPYVLNKHLNVNRETTVIFVTSGGMYTEAFNLETLEMSATGFKGSVAYARVKRAQTVLMTYLSATQRCHALSVHPGWTNTPGLSESLPGFYKVLKPVLRSLEAGADTLLWAATQAPCEPPAGQLYFDRRPRSMFRLAKTKVSDVALEAQGVTLAAWLDDRLSAWLT